MNVPVMFTMGSHRRAVISILATKLLKDYDCSVQNETREDILSDQKKINRRYTINQEDLFIRND